MPIKSEVIILGDGAHFHQETSQNQRMVPPWDRNLGRSSVDSCSSWVELYTPYPVRFPCASAERVPRCQRPEAEEQKDMPSGGGEL